MTDAAGRVEPSGVWATAVGVARVRAMETAREQPLTRDPLALAFATADGIGPGRRRPRARTRRRRWLGVAFSIVIRTKFLDDLLDRAVGSASGRSCCSEPGWTAGPSGWTGLWGPGCSRSTRPTTWLENPATAEASLPGFLNHKRSSGTLRS